MNPPLRLLHVSDVHLGSDAIWDAHLEEFRIFCRWARSLSPDLVLIVGDFFENNRVHPDLLEAVLEQLDRLPPTLILPGNHDALDDTSVYRRRAFRAPSNVHVLTESEGELYPVKDVPAVVWGRPTVSHSPAFRPLADLPRGSFPAWRLAMAHGEYIPRGGPTLIGSPIYPEDVQRPDWDYIALGHRPVFGHVGETPPAVFSGNLIHYDYQFLSGNLVSLEAGQRARVERVFHPL